MTTNLFPEPLSVAGKSLYGPDEAGEAFFEIVEIQISRLKLKTNLNFSAKFELSSHNDEKCFRLSGFSTE